VSNLSTFKFITKADSICPDSKTVKWELIGWIAQCEFVVETFRRGERENI
jgi:hypothetical protein